jgi:hypothetical protein
MLTFQQGLFESKPCYPAMDFIAGGCYSRVWAHPDGHAVIKRGSEDDGTLAYLYWCFEYQQACGQPMKGMPEIYSLVLLDGKGYVCTMKKYRQVDDSWFEGLDVRSYGCNDHLQGTSVPYMGDLIAQWCRLSLAVFGETYASDLHSGNFLMDGDTLVMTDPCGYREFERSDLIKLKHTLCASPEHFSLSLN